MPQHTVRAFDQELESVHRIVAEMGGLAEQMLQDATQALVRRDPDLAQRTIASDRRLDEMQRSVEEQTVLTIARRQPLAMDLRDLIAGMRIAGDLERIGDLAKNVAKRTIATLDQANLPKAIVGLRHMSELASAQLKQVLDSNAADDAEAAKAVWSGDETIDALYTSLFRELLTYMMEDPRNITFCTHLLFCAKNIERIGDHTTNIAENVHYLITGANIVDERPKSDETSSVLISKAVI
jgi:phosphate transport system protein